jgi:hypothetical protein
MAPLNTVANSITGWKAPLLIGGGHMSSALRKTIDEATVGSAKDATAQLHVMMRKKSPVELAALREACGILKEAMAAIRASVSVGHPTDRSILAGERAAIDHGAQDVRTLFSRDGGRTLRPFERLEEDRIDPLQVYVAVRKYNYWAEGFACISNEAQPATSLAALLLDNAVAAIGPGVSFAQLGKIMALSAPYRSHLVTQGAHATAIGLALDEPVDASQRFEAGGVYSVRSGLTDGDSGHAIVSAVIAVRDNGNDVLWRSAIA